MRRAVLLLTLAAVTGCSLLQPDGTRYFREGDYAAAEAAYESYLESGRAGGRREERALYHLGLIHAQPDSELHDPVAARRYLERLLAVEPPSPYAMQAALILDLQLEANRLEEAMADQRSLARRLLEELHNLRAEAERVESQASDEQERARKLSEEIEALRTRMAALAEELATRVDELERLKRIDLEDPP